MHRKSVTNRDFSRLLRSFSHSSDCFPCWPCGFHLFCWKTWSTESLCGRPKKWGNLRASNCYIPSFEWTQNLLWPKLHVWKSYLSTPLFDGFPPAQSKPSLEISAHDVFCQLRFEPTSSASSKASCNFLISRHSTASLKGCQVHMLYRMRTDHSSKQSKNISDVKKDVLSNICILYGCIVQVYLQLEALLCQPCTGLWPKLLLHGYHSFLCKRLTSVGRLEYFSNLNWFKRLVHLDASGTKKNRASNRPRVAQGHRGGPGQIAQPPWLLLSGLVYGNNGSQAILNIQCLFLAFIVAFH